jgi:hypothetical protein
MSPLGSDIRLDKPFVKAVGRITSDPGSEGSGEPTSIDILSPQEEKLRSASRR